MARKTIEVADKPTLDQIKTNTDDLISKSDGIKETVDEIKEAIEEGGGGGNSVIRITTSSDEFVGKEVTLTGAIGAESKTFADDKTATFTVKYAGDYTATCEGSKVDIKVGAIGIVVTAELNSYELYGFDEDPNDSNPATRISYPADVKNASYSPMTVNMSTGDFDLKDWADAFFIKGIRPVMLKSNGTVDYELDHNDQTKKLGGGTSDISNTSYDGNAMVEFPKMYFKRWQDATGKHVRICNQKLDEDYKCYAHMYDGNELDVVYLPMFEGSSVSSKVRSLAGQTPMNTQAGATEKSQIEANGAGWQFEDWSDTTMVEHLLFLIGKSTDLQKTFGNGHYTGGTGAASLLQTGTLKNKGMFYGTNGNVAVKFFWLENYYGDRWDRRYGVVYGTDGKIKVKPYPPYNIDGTGYINTGLTIGGTSGGYISKTAMTEYGEFPTEASGSETTYIPDGCWFNTTQLNFLLWGAVCNNDLLVGAAFDVGDLFSRSSWYIGPSLSYKKPV